MKLKKRLVSIVLAVAMLLTSFAVPQKAEAAEKQSKQYVCDGFNVEFSVTDEYENMFHADVTVTNKGNDVIRDWAFSCEFVHKITNIWNAQVLRTQEEFCVIGNADWNQNIAPGETASFGFSAEKTEDGEIVFPEYFELVMKETVTATTDYKAEFVVYSDWGAGNNGALILTNLTGRRIHNWKISFAYDREIVSIANAVIESYENGVYTLRNADYNADLEPYGAVHISFNGGQGDANAAATGFVLTETVFDLEIHPNTYAGTVTDAETGAALAGATVQILQNGTVVETVVTDGTGSYSFDLFKGTYTILVEKEHYKTAEVTFVSERNAKAPNVALSRIAYKLAGVVTDDMSGAALADVKVTVKGENGTVVEAFTDVSGAYAFELYYGVYKVFVEKDHYNAAEIAVVCGPETKAVDIALSQIAYKLAGVVTDGVSGNVLADVKVTVKGENGEVVEAFTDANGAYSFDLYYGNYTLLFEKEEYHNEEVNVVCGPETDAATIALARVTYVLTGAVTHEKDGKAIPNATVTAIAEDGTVAMAVTDENGVYTLELYRLGYEVVVEADKYITETFSVNGGDVTEADVALLREMCYEEGYVVDKETGERLADVTVTVLQNGEVVSNAVTDVNGVYSVTFYPGEYTISFESLVTEDESVVRNNDDTVSDICVELVRSVCLVNAELYPFSGSSPNNYVIKVYAGSCQLPEDMTEDLLVSEMTIKAKRFSVELKAGIYTVAVFTGDGKRCTSATVIRVDERIEDVTIGLVEFYNLNNSVSANWHGLSLYGNTEINLKFVVDVYKEGELIAQWDSKNKTLNLNGNSVFNYRVDNNVAYRQSAITMVLPPSSNLKNQNYNYTISVKSFTEGTTTEELLASEACVAIVDKGKFERIITMPETLEGDTWVVCDIIDGQIVER